MDKVALTGGSRRTYDFYLFHVDVTLGQGAGCYAFIEATKTGYSLVYIGETGDLSERFDSHHKGRCIKRHGATWKGVYRTASKAQAQRVEGDLLRRYSPPCND